MAAHLRSRAQLAAGLLLIAALVAAGRLLPIGAWMLALAASIRDAGPIGVALFVAAYIVSTVALVPGSLLTLAAGFAYGPLWGLAVVSPASVAGAAVSFLLGRTVLRQRVASRLEAMPRARAIDRAVGRDGFRLVLLLRLSPLMPFSLLNYALSLSSVSFGRYVAASFLGMLPGTFLYVYLGSLATTAAGLTAAAGSGGALRLALYGLGLAATIAVVAVATQTARRALREELEMV